MMVTGQWVTVSIILCLPAAAARLLPLLHACTRSFLKHVMPSSLCFVFGRCVYILFIPLLFYTCLFTKQNFFRFRPIPPEQFLRNISVTWAYCSVISSALPSHSPHFHARLSATPFYSDSGQVVSIIQCSFSFANYLMPLPLLPAHSG